MDAKTLAEIVKGELVGSGRFGGVHFDSREIAKGELFIPVKGRRDGHLFINDAFSRGAAGTLTERRVELPPGKFQVVVRDTLEAFERLARWKREKFKGTVIGVTGSVGKTTTKELLGKLLGRNCYTSKKSFNNLLGVCYTLSNLPESARFLVQELGTNSPGEIARLTKTVKPHVAVVTTVGKAHTQGFKTLEAIKKEKLSITEGAEVAVVPVELKEMCRADKCLTVGRGGTVEVKNWGIKGGRTLFTLKVGKEELQLESSIPGYSIVNAAAVAAAVALELGIPLRELVKVVKEFSPPEHRCSVERLPNGTLIDDCYNANPVSMENAVRVLASFNGPKVAVLGEMLELGEEGPKEHRKLGELLNALGIEELIAFGAQTEETVKAFKGKGFHFTNREEFIKFISEFPFRGKTVLVKGSRGNRLEEAVELIRERLK